jgi:hypothetical protein
MPRGRKFTDGFKDAPSDEEKVAEQIKFGLPVSSYTHNGDIATVKDRVIANNPTSLGHLLNIPLACLMRSSRRTDEDFAVDKAGHAFIRSDRERGIDPTYQAGIWVQRAVWDKFSPEQRLAWVHHLLLHLQVTATGKLRLIGHEADEFAEVARIYGAWHNQLALFAEANDAHQGPGGTVDTTAARTGDRGQRFPHTVQPGAIPPGPSSVN